MFQVTFPIRNLITTIKCFFCFPIATVYSWIVVFLVKHTSEIRFLLKPTFATHLSVTLLAERQEGVSTNSH